MSAKTLTARQLQSDLSMPAGTIQDLIAIGLLPARRAYGTEVLPLLALLQEAAELRLAGVLTRDEARQVIEQVTPLLGRFDERNAVTITRPGHEPIEMRFMRRAAQIARKYRSDRSLAPAV